MAQKIYRVHFYFDVADIVRLALQASEAIIETRGLQHRAQPINIAAAWLQRYLEKEMAIVVNRTEHTWAMDFVDDSLLNNEMLKTMAYHTFSKALHPAYHPCFHYACTMVLSPHDLKLEYVVTY